MHYNMTHENYKKKMSYLKIIIIIYLFRNTYIENNMCYVEKIL